MRVTHCVPSTICGQRRPCVRRPRRGRSERRSVRLQYVTSASFVAGGSRAMSQYFRSTFWLCLSALIKIWVKPHDTMKFVFFLKIFSLHCKEVTKLESVYLLSATLGNYPTFLLNLENHKSQYWLCLEVIPPPKGNSLWCLGLILLDSEDFRTKAETGLTGP